jgi:gliding motility-associated-like protein
MNAQFWMRSGGGTQPDGANDIAVDEGGFSYAVGSFSGSLSWGDGSPGMTSSGSRDGFLVVFDGEGEFVWQVKFGGSGADAVNGVSLADDGSVFVCGTYQQTLNAGSFSISASGSSDAFVAKVDGASGEVLWLETCGNSAVTRVRKIASDNQGNAVIVGEFNGTVNIAAQTLTATNGTYDVFLAKIDSDGQWIWGKSGEANQEDQGADVAIDGNGNVYITGTYSNTITFDQEHVNNSLNVGMAVKFNQDGQELGFHRVVATQIEAHSIAVNDQGVCYVTGKSQGNIGIDSANPITVNNAYSFFVIKFNASFAHQWSYEDGSSNEVSAESITLGADGKIYVAGTFACAFEDYAELNDQGPFISAGWFDVFVSALNDTGASASLEWTRQYGGPQPDGVLGIAVDAENHVIFCGDYESYFHVPASANFFALNYWSPGANDPHFYPNENNTVCADPDYGEFNSIKSIGLRDFYVAKAVDLSAWPFDIFHRESCSQDLVAPCIADQADPSSCVTLIESCGVASLLANAQTGSDAFLGPGYAYSWSNGSVSPGMQVTVDGNFTVSINRLDDCFGSQTASVSVNILDIPSVGISVSGNYFLDTDSIYNVCQPECVTATGSPVGGEWRPGVTNTTGSTAEMCEGGVYSYSYTDGNGCEGIAAVTVFSANQPYDASPELQFVDDDLNSNPVLELCVGEPVFVQWLDNDNHPNFQFYAGAAWTIEYNGQVIQEVEESGIYFPLLPTNSGTYTVTSVPFIYNEEPCNVIDTIYFPEQTIEVAVTLLETPELSVQLEGPEVLCPGEIIELNASGGFNYIWSAQGIVEYIDSNTVSVNQAGTYIVTSSLTLPNGCSDEASALHIVSEPSPPVIQSNPEHNYLCPGATVTLSTDDSTGICTWYHDGVPLPLIGSSIEVSIAGLYWCEQGLGSCQFESNPVEITNYATPYMVNTPNDLCLTGEVELCVSTYDQAEFTWQTPLSGDDRCITVVSPGIYSALVVACGISTTVTGTVFDTEYTPEITASPEVLCTGSDITLFGPPDMLAYDWMPGDDSLQNLTVYEGGLYVLTVTDSNGCAFASEPFTVQEITNDAPIIIDRMRCRGEEFITVIDSDPLSWWTVPDIVGDTVESNVISFNSVDLPLSIYYYDVNGICRSPIESFQIGLWPSSTVDILQGDTAFCAGGSYALSATCGNNAGIQFQWNLPNGSTQSGPSLSWIDSNAAPSGLYTVQTSDLNCDNGLDSVLVNIEYPHSTWILEDDSAGVCIGSDIVIATDSMLTNAVWTTPQGSSFESELFLENADFSMEGDYVIIAPGAICSFITDTLPLQVVEYPIVELNDSTVYCTSGYLIAHVAPGYDYYDWSNGDDDENAVVPLDGFLSVIVTNWPGCSDSDAFETTTVACLDEFPNIFSPNGDGLNDDIDFGLLRLPVEQVLIYNRWGDIVKKLTGSRLLWNGRNENNEEVSDGVYYWILALTGPNLTQAKLEGYVHVMRGE